MSYFCNYLNLKIAWLSDAQYLKLNLLLRAEICSSTVHMPKYLQISWYVSLEKAPSILIRAPLSSIRLYSRATQRVRTVAFMGSPFPCNVGNRFMSATVNNFYSLVPSNLQGNAFRHRHRNGCHLSCRSQWKRRNNSWRRPLHRKSRVWAETPTTDIIMLDSFLNGSATACSSLTQLAIMTFCACNLFPHLSKPTMT